MQGSKSIVIGISLKFIFKESALFFTNGLKATGEFWYPDGHIIYGPFPTLIALSESWY
jgi:hypothetical protein